MKLSYLIIPPTFAAAMWAQAISPSLSPKSVSVDTKAITARPAAASPLLGYTTGDPNNTGALDLRAILGKAAAPTLGDSLPLPANARSLYLAPRGLYALLSKTSDKSSDSLAVWTLHTGQPDIDLTGAINRPDVVTFSPRGTAAALYSQSNGRLQILTGLPLQPAVVAAPSVSLLGRPSRFAVSDDGSLVLVALPDGRVMMSKEHGNWVVLPANFFPADWTFIPATHELAIADATQQLIVLLTDPGNPAGFHVLAQGVKSSRLAVTKDGSYLAVADSTTNTLATIALKDGAITSRPTAHVQTLATLRDGFSFLVSTSPAVSIVTVAPTSAAPTFAQ